MAVVRGCPAGYGGDGFLAAGGEGDRDAKSQSKKARPGQATPGLMNKNQSLNTIQKMEFCGSFQYTSSLYDEGLHKTGFRERLAMQLFQITAVGGNRDDINITVV